VQTNFDAGPGELAKADIESGLFHEVATRHMFEHLMKREAILDPTSLDREDLMLGDVAKDFRTHDNVRVLVKTLVKLPAYRRMP